jgi:hypothetical protein
MSQPSHAWCKHVAGRPNGKNPNITATPVGRLFFPQSKSLGLDRTQYSNAVLAKIIYAGSNNTSYQQAAADLDHLAELDISAKQVRRLCKRVGDERVDERDAAVVTYQALPLVKRKSAPTGVAVPAVAVVSVDGGRVQIFERPGAAAPAPLKTATAEPAVVVAALTPSAPILAPPGPESAADENVPPAAPPVTAATTAPLKTATAEPAVVVAALTPSAPILAPPGPESAADENVPPAAPPGTAATTASGEEEEDEERRGKFWREDKIGLLMTMQSAESAFDPCPQIPKTFLNPTRITKLVRELKKRAPPREEAVKETDDPKAGDEALHANEAQWEPPEVQTKQVVATRHSWAQFGPMVAAAAWALGLFAAARKAFVADGAENNWTVHRQLFSSFVPILDFIHGLSYVFASAMAGRGFKEGWAVYERWIQGVWSGKVEQVIAELAVRQAELGIPAQDEPEGSPRAVVGRALTYLQNNQERMRYADYRRLGLPITSSYVESAVKQINYRVKGTEKFWNEAGAEELLQLRADYLSDGEVMEAYWERREFNETGQNRYRRVA